MFEPNPDTYHILYRQELLQQHLARLRSTGASRDALEAFEEERSLALLERRMRREKVATRDDWPLFAPPDDPPVSGTLFDEPIDVTVAGARSLPLADLPEPWLRATQRALEVIDPAFRSAVTVATRDELRGRSPLLTFLRDVPRVHRLWRTVAVDGAPALLLPRGVNLDALAASLRRAGRVPRVIERHQCDADVRVALPFPAVEGTLEQDDVVARASALPECLIVGDPAAGKTLVALLLAQQFGRRTLVIVQRRNLLEQWVERIRTTFPEDGDPEPLVTGVASGVARRARFLARITVMTASTFVRLPERGAGLTREAVDRTVGLIVVDEAHDATPRTAWALATYPGRLVGLTATDVRKDGLSILLPATFGPRVLVAPLAQLPVAAVLIDSGVTFLPRTDPPCLQDDQALQRFIERDAQYTRTCLEHPRLYSHLARRRSAIVEAVEVAHQQLVRDTLAELYPWVTAEITNGETADDDAVLARFRRGETQVLIGCNKLKDGVDLPVASVYVAFRPLADRKDLVQRVGRLLRPFPGKEQAHALFFFVRVAPPGGSERAELRAFRARALLVPPPRADGSRAASVFSHERVTCTWTTYAGERRAVRSVDVERPDTTHDPVSLSPSTYPSVFRSLLVSRGVIPDSGDDRAIRCALWPDVDVDPSALPGMDAWVALAARLRRGPEQDVVLWTDYDNDGLLSGAILHRTLTALGARVQHVVPLRHRDGYGLSTDAWERLVTQRGTLPQLLVTADCGTASGRAIAEIAAAGVDVLVVDHHELQGAPPERCTLLNPKRPGVTDPALRALCTGGITWLMLRALEGRVALPFTADDVLPEAALATVADVVPLSSPLNRQLVQRGLARMNAGHVSAGMEALLQATITSFNFRRPDERFGARVTATDLGFALGPAVNAPGRLGDASIVFRLLTESDPAAARSLADQAVAVNRRRQALDRRAYLDALARLPSEFTNGDRAIVLADPTWDRGIVGIVAGRLKERFGRPAFVGEVDPDRGVTHLSARSVDGVPLVPDVLGELRGLLVGGGHAKAAGARVETARLDELRTRLNQLLARYPASLFGARPQPEATIALHDLSAPLLRCLLALVPYGEGNARPRFSVGPVEVLTAATKRLGGEDVLECTLAESTQNVRALWSSPRPVPAFLREGARVTVLATVGFSPKAYRMKGRLEPVLSLFDATLATV